MRRPKKKQSDAFSVGILAAWQVALWPSTSQNSSKNYGRVRWQKPEIPLEKPATCLQCVGGFVPKRSSVKACVLWGSKEPQ